MLLSVLMLNIALLFLPFSSIGGGKIATRAKPTVADPISAKPFMTGIRLTSWDGRQQSFVLQIDSIKLIYKTLGPFELEDQRDISANNCNLRSDSASLSENIHEIGKFLSYTMKSHNNPIPKPVSSSPPALNNKSGNYKETLVKMPPTFIARPFTCVISQPQGLETIFQGDLATFDPTQTGITLEGNVRVKGGNQTCLTAEHIIWRVPPQELYVEGAYRFQTGRREITGQDACFSIADGVLKPVKSIKTQTLACLRGLTSSAPMAPVMISSGGKGLRSLKKPFLSQLSQTLLQNLNAAVAPPDQRLTSKNKRKKASFSYAKPNVYPLPPSLPYSAQETVDRELFCEKSLVKYYKK